AAAVEDVAVLIADVAAGEVDRLGPRRYHAGQLRVADLGEVGEGVERRQIPRREDVYPREAVRVLQLDDHHVVVGADRGDLRRFEARHFEVPQLAEQVAGDGRAVGDADADLLAGHL